MAKVKFKIGDRVRTKTTDVAPLRYQNAEGVVEGTRGDLLYVKFPDGTGRPFASYELDLLSSAKSLLRAKYKAARKPELLTFADLSIGERFSSAGFSQGRLYQKITDRFAIDLSEGVDRDGFFIKERFVGTYPVLRRTEPQVSFDPAKLIQVN